jgi:hypothetical protein
MTRGNVYDAIDSERDFQDRKWGTIEQHPHEVAGWLTLIRQHLRDSEEAWSGGSSDYVALQEIRKILAIGVACAEQHGIQTRSRQQEMEPMRR